MADGSLPRQLELPSLASAIERAARRIRPHVRETPLEESPALGAACGARVFLKLENCQRTGSFKLRGAVHRLLALGARARARGVVAASSGNHGAGVACAAAALGCRSLVLVPEATPDHKLTAIAGWGAEVRRAGRDCVQTELAARDLAARERLTYVSPYNDLDVVAGQGTVGVELDRQIRAALALAPPADRASTAPLEVGSEPRPPLDAVFVALGGGGLASGVAAALKARHPGVEVIACSPAHSPVMHASLQAGRIVEMECQPTLSDATAGGVEPGAVTFDLCRRLVDRSLLVSEAEIATALRLVVERHHTLVEGAAAVAVAGLLASGRRYAGRRVAVVLCGANIGADALARALRLAAPGSH